MEVVCAIRGERVEVVTPHGPVAVTVCGDRTRSACVTFHDVGLRHSSCFQGLLVVAAAERASFPERFCFYHIDAPGAEEGASGLPPGFRGLSMRKLVDAVGAVLSHFQLAGALGLGVGAGGYVLCQAAMERPGAFDGLVLVSPLARGPDWWEWGLGHAARAALRLQGWSNWAVDHVLMRLFSAQAREFNGYTYGGDLIQSFRREVTSLDPEGVEEFLGAVLGREDLVPQAERVRCGSLVISGDLSGFSQHALQLSQALLREGRARGIPGGACALVTIDGAGSLVTEERPQAIVNSIELFLRRMGQEGKFV